MPRSSRFQVASHDARILREIPRVGFRHRARRPLLPEPEEILRTWLGARRVGERDTHLYWFLPTPAGAFRQASPLDEADAARWRSLPRWFRKLWSALAVREAERTN